MNTNTNTNNNNSNSQNPLADLVPDIIEVAIDFLPDSSTVSEVLSNTGEALSNVGEVAVTVVSTVIESLGS